MYSIACAWALARCGFLWATSQPLFARYQVSLFAVQVEAAPLLVPPIVYQGQVLILLAFLQPLHEILLFLELTP